jgi:ribosomal protein S18 acetylase RimI-like enzyme
VNVRTDVAASDVHQVERLVRATGMFREDETVIAVELVVDGLEKGADSGYRFAFVDGPDGLLGYACWGDTPCTLGTWDLYWIAVQPDGQGRGLGKQLVAHVEQDIRARGGRRVFVDTSGRPDYAPTRGFYDRCGYRVVATIDDFYTEGDAKVVYGKTLVG